MLFNQGIKVLSLFFIDEVAKYRQYDEDGEKPGEYAQIFEEEYRKQLDENLDAVHGRSLRQVPEGNRPGQDPQRLFLDRQEEPSADRPEGQSSGRNGGRNRRRRCLRPDPEGQGTPAFLRRTGPLHFLPLALREGWDNPNVFVICTLKHSDNTVSRRQEVGRGMRISVNQLGDRMDDPATVHQTNVLTVVANESYKDFVSALQRDISESLSARPRVADEDTSPAKCSRPTKATVEVTPQWPSRYTVTW